MHTIGEFLTWAEQKMIAGNVYCGHGTDNPWDEAVMLVLHVLGAPADAGIEMLSEPLNASQIDKLKNLVEQRVTKKIPVPYLTNTAWYAGEKYYVNQDVLIPRSPIAELILNKFQPWITPDKVESILDLCTGSGCMAIVCAKVFHDSKVFGSDISKKALLVAKKNKDIHEASNLTLIESDLFKNIEQQFDVIITNPPYVSNEEIESLPEEYSFEPKIALHSRDKGLEITKNILKEAYRYLNDDGILIVEVGNSCYALEREYPQIPFTWLEFEHGGEGVFLLTKKQLGELDV